MIAAVVDINLLIAGFITGRRNAAAATVSLVDLWLDGHIGLVVCPTYLEELEAALRSHKVARYIPEEDVPSYMTLVAATAQVEADPVDAPSVSRDSSDDYLFALAASAAVVLVSGDRDVLEVEDPPCPVLNIGDFLRLVRRTPADDE